MFASASDFRKCFYCHSLIPEICWVTVQRRFPAHLGCVYLGREDQS